MNAKTQVPFRDLQPRLDHVRLAPSDAGTVEHIVCRPARDRRKVLQQAVLDVHQGLVGDCWRARGSSKRPDGSADPEKQLTLAGARAIGALAPSREDWALAGDQLYVDLDLSVANLPPGSRLAVGDAVIEITAKPHTGCKKFTQRFGSDATRWVNSKPGLALRLRGVNGWILDGGTVRPGDQIRVLHRAGSPPAE